MVKPADIGFLIHRDSWISKTIAWFSQSKWSHVFLIKEITTKNIYTVETSDYEVTIQQFDFYQKDPNVSYEIWSPIDITDEQREIIVNESLALHGKVYGYIQFISLGLKGLLKRIGINIGNFLPYSWVCHEVVGLGYKKSPFEEFQKLNIKNINQQEFYELVKNSHKFKLKDIK